MILGLLCILIISGSESKILSVNPKLKRSIRQPLQIDRISSEGSSHRSKRHISEYDHSSDWNNKINVTKSVLANDSHGTAYVEWGGTDKNSDTILVLTRDPSSPPTGSTLYVSTDYGKTFQIENVGVKNNAQVDHIFSYIYQSQSNHKMFMLNDETYKAVVVSTNEGKSWTSYPTDFTPSYIEHHPTVERLLLAHDVHTHKLYLSKNFGETFQSLLADRNVIDFYWGTSQFDSLNTLFVTIDNGNTNGTFSVYSSTDFFATTKNLIDDSAIEFTVVDDFYFYAKKSTHQNHGDRDQDLFISYDRSMAVKALFPPTTDDNPTTEFYIADAGEGQAFVAVSHKDNKTHLYITEHKGQNMVLSLERILFTNQASYDRIAWLDESIEPFTDFQAIEGLPGVFIASQLDKGRVGHRRIHSVMTYNKGGTWQYIQPPRWDMDGDPSECFLPDCTLHISLMFGIRYPYARHTPLLSIANAPGFIIASGNMGSSHSTMNNVFMSNDGGVEWSEVLQGQYYYQIADHGGIVVAAPRTSTRIIMYSHDEGVTWFNKTISPDTDITIYGLVTEPGEITTIFNVYATEDASAGLEWIVFTIDFKDFLGPRCNDYDFMTWSIRDELKNTECVLGKDTKYERKRPTSHCYIGSDYVRFVEDKPCPCQASDFECDFLYYRENGGDPCVMVDGVSEDWFIPDDCKPGQTYNRSMGYIKIEGDMCQSGEEAIFSYKATKCHDQSMTVHIKVTPNTTVEVGSTVTFDAHTGTYVDDIYFLWHITDNTTFSGTGTNGAQFTNTFSQAGTYVVSLTANNGAGPVVSMVVIEVDAEIKGLDLQFEPVDPAIEEGMIFVVIANHDSNYQDIGRLKYKWSTGVESYLPILLYSFDDPGRHTVTCTVFNSVNSLDLTVTFTVSDLTVTSLGAIPVSSSSVQVVWNPPALRPGLVSGYTLEYRTGDDGRWHEMSTGGNSSQTNYQVNGLTDNTLYQFRIKTTSSGGTQSKQSAIVTATTLPMNSLDPAGMVKAVLSGHEVNVSWTSPGGSVTGFIVEYWMSDRPNEIKSHATDSKSVTSLKLTDLTAGAPYSIRVKTLYSNAVAYADVINVQIEGTTPEELEDIRAFPENGSAIVIVWGKPRIHVDGYHIYNATDSTVLTTVADTEVTFTHLLPYTQYMFNIEPFTGDRIGKKSNVILATTDTGVPSSVKDLNCYTQSGAAVLSWHKPARPNGPIEKYLISYDDPDLSEMGIPSYVSKDSNSLKIPKLKQYAVYKFSVAVQGPLYTSQQAYTTCSVESASGLPGPPTDLYVKETHISYIEILWRHPLIIETNLTYEIRYGLYKNGARFGGEQVMTTNNLYTTLRDGISPSTQYEITVAAKNEKGVGTATQPVLVVTLTPPIGSVEYEFKFNAADVDTDNLDNFENALKEEIVQVTKISRSRLSGFTVTHKDTTDIKVAIWIAPRDTADDSVESSTEQATGTIDEKIKKKEFVVGTSKAVSGQATKPSVSHHDVAEIVIPGVCGLVIVVLVAGVLYYRNKYTQLMRRYTFRSRYANDTEDVNMIECADEPDVISSSDLGRGALSITNEGSTQRPRGIRNFFERFNYAQVDQNDPDELIDDDEEHLLPL